MKQSEIYIKNTSLFIPIHEIYESKKTGYQYIWKENHYNIQKEEEEE